MELNTIIANIGDSLAQKAGKGNDETITGTWTFNNKISGSIDQADTTTASDRSSKVVINGTAVSGDSIARLADVSSLGDTLLPENAFDDSLRAHALSKIPVAYNFSVDTSQTIGTSDTVDVFYDIESGERVIVARARSSAGGIQNATFETQFILTEDVSGLDSLNVMLKTSHASSDSQKVNVYVGTQNLLTGTVSVTDSSVGNSGTSWVSVRLYLGDDSISKGDIVILRFRFWSINSTKAVYIKRPYLVASAA